MDMALLSKMVRELLLDHDYVGLPGVGTFVAETVPASFSDRGYTVNPPYRKLSFQVKCIEDELLVSLYSVSNHLAADDARTRIKAYMEELKSLLLERRALSFPDLGRLRVTKENNIFFVSDENPDIYPEGFGLQPLSLKTHREPDETVKLLVRESSVSEISVAVTTPETHSAEPVPHNSTDTEAVVDEKTVSETATSSAGKKPFRLCPDWKVILLIVFGIAIVLFAAFVIVAQVKPELLDPILYSPEELKILYS